jgi:hypothetical protein
MKRYPKKGYTRRRPSPSRTWRKRVVNKWRQLTRYSPHVEFQAQHAPFIRPCCIECGERVLSLLGMDQSRGPRGVFVCAQRGFVDLHGNRVIVDRHAVERSRLADPHDTDGINAPSLMELM